MVQESLTARVPQDEPSAARSPRPRVLVIEADSSERSVLNVAFASGGFEVVSVETGAQAIRRLAAPGVRFDAVLVDAALRGEDGYSLCAQIKGDARVADLPVWLISAKPAGEDKELGQVVGAEGVVGKPTYVRDVVVLVRLRLAPKHDDGSVSFETESMPLGHLLRAVLSAGLSGAISFQQGRGSIRFRGNKVLESRFCGVGGAESLIRALALAEGTYSVRLGVQKGLPQFHFTLTELVTSAFPRLNKWNEVLARSVPLDAQLGVDFGRLKTALSTMPDGVNDVVRLFDGVRTVRSVLMDSPLNESTSLAITTRLYLMGVVAPLPKFPPGQELLSAPSIFEPAPLEAEEAMRALFNVVPMQIATNDDGNETSDWYRAPQGNGVEAASSPEEWTAGPITDASPEVQALIERQFAAFNVQPIVEDSDREVLAPDLSAFNEGATFEHRPPPGLEHAFNQFERSHGAEALTPAMTDNTSVIDALEMDFFRQVEVITKPEGRVAKAVLGFTAENATDRQPERNPLWLVGTMALALVTVTALAAWTAAPRVNRSAPLADAIMAESDPFAPSVFPYPKPLLPVPPGTEEEAAVAAASPVGKPLPEPTKVDSIDQNEINKLINDATADYEKGRVKDAIAKLETVITQSPSETQAWVQLGMARYDSGDSGGAEEAALTALAMAPENARAHLLLATVAQNTGRKDLARTEFETYLKLDPKGPFAEDAKALLRGR